MKLHPITEDFLYLCDIHNNKDINPQLQNNMILDVLKNKTKTQLSAMLIFSFCMILGYVLFTKLNTDDPISQTILLIVSTMSCLTIPILLMRLSKFSKRTITNNDLILNHWKNIQNNFINQNTLPPIIEDCLKNQLISRDDATKTLKKTEISQIQNLYQKLLTFKLLSTPLPSTTISLNEHKKEFVQNNN